jgi:exosortase D (VPLPA-CTERM-specific)
MSIDQARATPLDLIRPFITPGTLMLVLACVGAWFFFQDGFAELLRAWQLPEYSHGPLIPVLSLLLFLRQLKAFPIDPGPKTDRMPGLIVTFMAIIMGAIGTVTQIGDIVAYAIIVWVFGILLTSFGWQTGKHFWPPVLHLVYMLPLPGFLYYQFSTKLQFISSELGVMFLRMMGVPVFLDGNIIDLGVMSLHVAEACSGLRYLFPILSFSYIFAVLYKGPMWHKAVLLISAAPITILMNSVRIGIAGYIVNNYGIEWIEGFSHFFEGWVIFLACIIILFGLASVMLYLDNRNADHKRSLPEALDLDTDGLGTQAARISLIKASPAFITGAVVVLVAGLAMQFQPQRAVVEPAREGFVMFPRTLGDWQQIGTRQTLEASVAEVLAADDYHSVNFQNPEELAGVGLFMSWYKDQIEGTVHSPEACLPGAGWEIAWLDRIHLGPQLGVDEALPINEVIIQKGATRMMVYYWIEQQGRMVANQFHASFLTIWDRSFTGRTDTGLVRLTTPILEEDGEAGARARLNAMTLELLDPLPRFFPPR